MAGNTRRRGARRKAGTKKGAVVGSGGQRRRALQGKGPTPPAEARKGHPAARRAARTARVEGTGGGPPRQAGAGAQRSGSRRRAGRGAAEVIAGRNAVLEALRAEVPVTHLYVAERIDSDERVREILKIAADRGLPLLEAPRPELDRISGGVAHQGMAAQVPPYDYAHPDDLLDRARAAGETPLIVALDGVTDPRNLGAIVRSAAAFGAHGVLVPQRRAAGMTAAAWKASAGAAARLPVAQATNLTRALDGYRSAGVFVVGLAADGEVDIADIEMAPDPLALVVGSEAKGLSRLVAAACDMRARIPMAAGNESLNAGVAAGVALYEIARRRRATGDGLLR
jgi:23S rRNA (guanosine2251-2'-O)-methyltransferase